MEGSSLYKVCCPTHAPIFSLELTKIERDSLFFKASDWVSILLKILEYFFNALFMN